MRKFIAIIIELIPVVAAVTTYLLIFLPLGNASVKQITTVTMVITLLGFIFGIIGKKIESEDRTVRIFGILAWLSTISVFVFFAVVFYVLGRSGM